MNFHNGYFSENVKNDVLQFLHDSNKIIQKKVLIFPPVSSYHRFIIHQIIQQEFHLLSSFSIGQGFSRRTVVCYSSHLISDSKLNGKSSPNPSRQIENSSSSKMGVEESYSLPPDYSITSSRQKPVKDSVEIYRPPAARRMSNDNTSGLVTNIESSVTPRSKQRRPDRAVYVPKARRSMKHNMDILFQDDNVEKKVETNLEIKQTNENSGKSMDCCSSQVTEQESIETIELEPKNDIDINLKNNLDLLTRDEEDCENINLQDSAINIEIDEKKPKSFVSDVLIISNQEDHKENVDKNDTLNIKPVKVKAKKIARSKSKPASPPPPSLPLKINRDDCDWDTLFDDDGECLDPTLIEELTKAVGEVTIEQPKQSYKSYSKTIEVSNDEFGHVVEIYNFPSDFKTSDLAAVFSPFKNGGFELKWVDDTHCLGVFSSPLVAAEVLASNHSFVKTRPLSEATVASRTKVRKSAEFLQPYKSRPETCAALARRLVTGALGVRLATARQEREHEKNVLRQAKERKELANKQREDVWEGIISQK